MAATRVTGPGACEDARARASLALDGELRDDVSLVLLHGHLARCAECAGRVAGMQAASRLLRTAPLEPYRCAVTRSRLRRARAPVRRLQWSCAAVAAIALLVGTASLPRADAPAGPDGQRAAVAPPRLPIGQRSAIDDFAAAHAQPGLAG